MLLLNTSSGRSISPWKEVNPGEWGWLEWLGLYKTTIWAWKFETMLKYFFVHDACIVKYTAMEQLILFFSTMK